VWTGEPRAIHEFGQKAETMTLDSKRGNPPSCETQMIHKQDFAAWSSILVAHRMRVAQSKGKTLRALVQVQKEL